MQEKSRIEYRSLIIDYQSVLLDLHRNFTTAHSSSSTRTNFFIRVGSGRPDIYLKYFGYGECGLPPKKPGCYMSDINDCFQFMKDVKGRLETEQLNNSIQGQKLDNLPSEVEQVISNMKSLLKNQIIHLLRIIQQYQPTENFRAPKCALQFALFDLLCKYHQKTLTQVLFPTLTAEHKSYSFYTASLQQNPYMLQNIKSHIGITKYIKIKYNSNVSKLVELLEMVNKQDIVNKIIIDANCSWSIQDMEQFVVDLKKMKNGQQFVKKILYIQQPFNLQISNLQKWAQLKDKLSFKILADESFRNQQDIDKIKKVAHAVNIKTEKAGGVVGTLKAALKAKQSGLQVMFGSMCSTQLGCTQTFQFYPLAEYLDIDGALLVKTPQIEGGFIWQKDGLVVPCEKGFGLRIDAWQFFKDLKEQKQ